MANTNQFSGVTTAIWACVKSTSEQQQGTVYDSPDANQGTATTNTVVGEVVLSFNFDPSTEIVAYTIEQKPLVVTDDEIWNGIQQTINQCQG